MNLLWRFRHSTHNSFYFVISSSCSKSLKQTKRKFNSVYCFAETSEYFQINSFDIEQTPFIPIHIKDQYIDIPNVLKSSRINATSDTGSVCLTPNIMITEIKIRITATMMTAMIKVMMATVRVRMMMS